MQRPESLADYSARCQQLLAEWLPKNHDILLQAMYASVMAGGKRLRPLLVYAAGYCVEAPLGLLDHAAVAVEYMHAYSLIHDDLPAMDNADLRHGQPTCHRQFGEATAILAGDALQSLAFEVLAKNQNAQAVYLLARASGAYGMALGQSLDLQAEKALPNLAQLQKIHRHKTGALMTASVQLGLLCGGVIISDPIFGQLTEFANNLGLAFQIQDDILDIETPTTILGKTQGQDIMADKATYPKLMGIEKSRILLIEILAQAEKLLAAIPRTDLLWQVLQSIRQRQY